MGIYFLNIPIVSAVHVENGTVASVGHLVAVADGRHAHKDVYQLDVLCRQVGETEVTYRVGNSPTQTNVHPVQASVQIKVCVRQQIRYDCV